MSDFDISFTAWRQVRIQQPLWPVYRFDTTPDGSNAKVYTGNTTDRFVSFIQGEDVALFGTLCPDAVTVEKETDALALLAASRFPKTSDGARTEDGKLVVSTYPTIGNRVNIVTHRWNDPTTWYTKSVFESQEAAQRIGPRTYQLQHPNVIDAAHGKIWDEDFLTPDNGEASYLPQVFVDSAAQQEVTPGFEDSVDPSEHGDWVLNYATGEITFTRDISSGALVQVSYFRATTSEYYVQPVPGKQLDVDQVEIQFGMDTGIRDTTTFELEGYAGVFAPDLVEAGHLGPQQRISLGPPAKYKGLADFCNEANGMLPLIPMLEPDVHTWRDLDIPIVTFPWNYQAVIQLKASWGMRIVMRLEQDIPHEGKFVTVTLYGLSVDE